MSSRETTLPPSRPPASEVRPEEASSPGLAPCDLSLSDAEHVAGGSRSSGSGAGNMTVDLF